MHEPIKTDQLEFQNIQRWMYRNARPVDLAHWQFLFENGSKENILHALSAYQNVDGGFGHAFEPDMWNPHSNGIQTWFAIEFLRKIEMNDGNHPMIQGILRFLSNGEALGEIESTNKYPHAPWWHWKPDMDEGLSPCLAGFAIKYAQKGTPLHERAKNIAKLEAKVFLENSGYEDHKLLEYIRLYQFCYESGNNNIFDMDSYVGRITVDLGKYLANPHLDWLDDAFFMLVEVYSGSIIKFSFEDKVAKQIDETAKYLLTTINCDGIWNLPEGWIWPTNYKGEEYSSYSEECSISRNWWRGYRVVAIVRFLQQLNYL